MTTNQTETKSVTAVLVYWELCFPLNSAHLPHHLVPCNAILSNILGARKLIFYFSKNCAGTKRIKTNNIGRLEYAFGYRVI